MIKIILNSPCNFTTSSELLTNPIGLSYIKAYCEKYFPCQIKIVPALNLKIIEAEKPDIVGISCYAATFGKVSALARLCKESGVFVVVGGEQITTLPHLLTKDMDVGVRGEGEYLFLELIKVFDHGWNPKTLRKLIGLVFRDEMGDLIISEPSKKPVDLDQLPIPDLIQGNDGTDLLCLMTSRGCPYRCIFCATGWHKNVHWMSPETLIKTIEVHLEKYPNIRRVKFWDDLFTVKLSRVEKIVELILDRQLNKRLTFSVCTRADHINETLLTLLKEMNCTHVSMGLESGSDNTLKYIDKRCGSDINQQAIELLSAHHFSSEASFIIGFPFETNDDIQQTYNFIKESPIDKFQFFLPVPYPGTGLWQYAEKKGLVSEEMEWKKLDLIATMTNHKSVLKELIVMSEKLTRQELYEWMARFHRLSLIKTARYTLRLLMKDPLVIFYRLKREVLFSVRKLFDKCSSC